MRSKARGYMTLDVYSALKRKIITLEIQPGEALRETDICRDLGAGRTPFREAVLMLKAENLLDARPNQPPYVKDITLKGVRDIILPFLTVSKMVMRLAVQRITKEALGPIRRVNGEVEEAIDRNDGWSITACNRKLHSLIGQATDNEYVISIYEMLLNQQERLSYLAVSEELESGAPLHDHLALIKNQHQSLLEALETNDADRAEILAEEHIRSFQRRISAYLAL